MHPHTVTTTGIKANMRHIHTSIISMYLATRGNNKILRTPPPHISSSEETLSRHTRRTLAQLQTNKSPFIKLYLHKVNANSHPSPLCPLSNTRTHNTHHLFYCSHIRTPLSSLDLCTVDQMDREMSGVPQSGRLDPPYQGLRETKTVQDSFSRDPSTTGPKRTEE